MAKKKRGTPRVIVPKKVKVPKNLNPKQYGHGFQQYTSWDRKKRRKK